MIIILTTHLINQFLLYFSIGISNSGIEFLSFESDEILSWLENTARGGNRTSCVDVVSCEGIDYSMLNLDTVPCPNR